MKKVWFVLLAMFILSGCSKMESQTKHIQSSWVGLDRVVTLYSNDGKVIKEWSGKITVENHGGSSSFVIKGKTVIISGTYTIEEM